MDWQHVGVGRLLCASYVFAIPGDAQLPPSLAEKSCADTTRAYLCEGLHCSPPISSREEWETLITDSAALLEPASLTQQD